MSGVVWVLVLYVACGLGAAVALGQGLYPLAEQQQRWGRWWERVLLAGALWPVLVAAMLAWRNQRARRWLQSLADPPSTGGPDG